MHCNTTDYFTNTECFSDKGIRKRAHTKRRGRSG